MLKKILLSYLIVCQYLLFYASGTDSIKESSAARDSSKFYPVLWQTNMNSMFVHEQTLDTALQNIHISNGALRNSPLQITLGNLGAPTQHLVFERRRNSEFYFITPYLHYYQMPDDQIFYNINKPFTNLYFSSGPDKEQLVDFLHTQNVFKDLNLGLRLHYFKALGQYDYEEQNSKGNIVNAWAVYESPKYRLKASYFFGKNEIDENGGLDDTDLFEDQIGVRWKLNDAGSKNQYQLFQLFQEWNLLRPRIAIDSIAIEYPPYKLALRHKFIYNRADRSYYDKLLSEDIYTYLADPSSKSMNERIWGNDLTNSLGIILNGKIKNVFPSVYIDLGLENQKNSYYDYLDLYPEKEFENVYSQAGFNLNSSKVKLSTFYKYYLSGEKSTDQNLNIILNTDFSLGKKENTFILSYDNIIKSPDILIENIQTNTFFWNYDFEKTNENRLKAELHLFSEILNVYFSDSKFSNYIYFNDSAYPEQANDLNVMTLGSVIKLKLGWFYFDTDLAYQKSSSTNALSLPDFSSNSSLYLMHAFYKSRLLVKFGVDVLFFSKYYASAYDPIKGVFYNQNDKKIGNYPFADVFLDIKYKQLKAFLKYTQLYSLISDKPDYFSVIDYPQYQSGIYFGFAWHFYN